MLTSFINSRTSWVVNKSSNSKIFELDESAAHNTDCKGWLRSGAALRLSGRRACSNPTVDNDSTQGLHQLVKPDLF